MSILFVWQSTLYFEHVRCRKLLLYKYVDICNFSINKLPKFNCSLTATKDRDLLWDKVFSNNRLSPSSPLRVVINIYRHSDELLMIRLCCGVILNRNNISEHGSIPLIDTKDDLLHSIRWISESLGTTRDWKREYLFFFIAWLRGLLIILAWHYI